VQIRFLRIQLDKWPDFLRSVEAKVLAIARGGGRNGSGLRDAQLPS